MLWMEGMEARLRAFSQIMTESAWTPSTPLCGRILTLVRHVSSLTCTSSPVQVIFVMRTQLPIVFFQPMTESQIIEYGFIVVSLRIVELRMRTPGPILHPAPTTTLGPSSAVGSTCANSCTITRLPVMRVLLRSISDYMYIDCPRM